MHCTDRTSLPEGTFAMKTYVVTGALIVAFPIPALAGSGAYYVGLRLGGGYCMVMTHVPSPKKYKMMGKYGTRAEAQKAMTAMADCH